MAASIITYALDKVTGETVHIDTAPNGLSCNCKCAKCEEDMIAVQGKSENHKEWHFRHNVESNCTGGQETAIHKLAKQIIVDNLQIKIPGETLIYTNARQEERLGSITPDVSVLANGESVHFEIVVTNQIGGVKEMVYKNGEHKCVEIVIANISITPEELEDLVLNKVDNKRKIFWEREVIHNYDFTQELGLWVKQNLTEITLALRYKSNIFNWL